MKRIASLFLALLMLLGCASFAAAEEPVEIEYYFGLGGKLGDIFLGLAESFNASQSQYKIVPVQFASFNDAQKNYQAALAAGTAPALWQSQRTRALNFVDYLEPLNDYYANDAEFNADDIFAGAMSSVYALDEETIIGVPVYASSQLMYYRIDAFEGYDVDYAFASYQNLAEVTAKIVADPNNNFTIGWIPMWHNDTWLECVMSMGGGRYTDSTMKEVGFLDGRWAEVMTQFQEWFQSGLMFTHSGGNGWEYWYKNIDEVMNGNACGYIGSPADMGDLDFTKIAAHTRPGWKDNDPQCVSEAHIMVMSKDVSNEQKAGAWEFIKYIGRPENASQITMVGGYLPVRNSTFEDPEFKAYSETQPAIAIGAEQMNMPSNQTIDITGGYINTAINDLVDNVLMNDMDVEEALEIAYEEGQQALDDYWESVEE